ncbi:MAG: DUF935 domain-containing protein [Magnetococcus sp. DMHC-6]
MNKILSKWWQKTLFQTQELSASQVKLKKNFYKETAIDELGSWLIQVPDPDTILVKLGLSRASLRSLEGDDEIFAALETRREAVLATPWRLEPGEGVVSTFVKDQIKPCALNVIRGIWAAVPYGYSVQEIIYKKLADNMIGIDRVVEKPFEWFAPQADNTLLFYSPGELSGTQIDTKYKFLLTRRLPTYRNPYGEALLSRLYWPWYFRTQGLKFWVQFLERFGQPLLLGSTSGDKTEMANQLVRAIQDAVVVIGQEDKVEAIAPSNAGESFSRFEGAMERRVQKVILGQTLTTDVGDSGSFAAALVHDTVRQDRRLADIRMVIESMQLLINRLTQLNFPAAQPPRFVMEDGQGLESLRAARDLTLTQANPNLAFTELYYRDIYGLESEHFQLQQQS